MPNIKCWCAVHWLLLLTTLVLVLHLPYSSQDSFSLSSPRCLSICRRAEESLCKRCLFREPMRFGKRADFREPMRFGKKSDYFREPMRFGKKSTTSATDYLPGNGPTSGPVELWSLLAQDQPIQRDTFSLWTKYLRAFPLDEASSSMIRNNNNNLEAIITKE